MAVMVLIVGLPGLSWLIRLVRDFAAMDRSDRSWMMGMRIAS
jgi:hypothetical protein